MLNRVPAMLRMKWESTPSLRTQRMTSCVINRFTEIIFLYAPRLLLQLQMHYSKLSTLTWLEPSARYFQSKLKLQRVKNHHSIRSLILRYHNSSNIVVLNRAATFSQSLHDDWAKRGRGEKEEEIGAGEIDQGSQGEAWERREEAKSEDQRRVTTIK